MDNGDGEGNYLPRHNRTFHGPKYGPRQPHILSRIRNFNDLARTSISSLFLTPTSNTGSILQERQEGTNSMTDNWDCDFDIESARNPDDDRQGNRNCDNRKMEVVDTSTPISTRPTSPLQLNRFSDVKRIFNNFSRSRQLNAPEQMQTRLNTVVPIDVHTSKNTQDPKNHTKTILRDDRETSNTRLSCTALNYSFSEHLTTPPLTPDLFDDCILLSSPPDDSADMWNELYPEWTREHSTYYDEDQYLPSNSPEIQQGKRPERHTHHDISITDPQGLGKVSPPVPQDDEWYGLEYTLELSTRERRPSGTQSFSAGEHSKSRESWAALRRGRIHPFFEDEDYYEWKNWHRYLDRQDERKRHRKGLEFRARAKDLAWYYADEMATRDVMYWQKEVYGVVARDVKERLAIIAERRPDPYYPAKKHTHAWYLKRSRSVGCLRELQPVPGRQWPSQDYNQAVEFDEENEPVIETEDDCPSFLED